MTKKAKGAEKDRFIQIAAGGKKMTGEIKRMAEIPPLPISRSAMEANSSPLNICAPTFDEDEAYRDFLREKSKLREYYAPYLNNFARKLHAPTVTLSDFLYRKETDADKADFTLVLSGEGEWEKVKIPHYTGPDGRWNAFYRTEIAIEKKLDGKYYILDFEAVDYIAEIYINGRMAGRHTGFLPPSR